MPPPPAAPREDAVRRGFSPATDDRRPAAPAVVAAERESELSRIAVIPERPVPPGSPRFVPGVQFVQGRQALHAVTVHSSPVTVAQRAVSAIVRGGAVGVLRGPAAGLGDRLEAAGAAEDGQYRMPGQEWHLSITSRGWRLRPAGLTSRDRGCHREGARGVLVRVAVQAPPGGGAPPGVHGVQVPHTGKEPGAGAGRRAALAEEQRVAGGAEPVCGDVTEGDHRRLAAEPVEPGRRRTRSGIRAGRCRAGRCPRRGRLRHARGRGPSRPAGRRCRSCSCDGSRAEDGLDVGEEPRRGRDREPVASHQHGRGAVIRQDPQVHGC